MTTEEYLKLQQKLDKARQQSSEIEGAIKELRKRLKKEFNCNSVDEGKKKMSKLSKEVNQLDYDINKARKEFENAYDGRLSSNGQEES
jgi:predicted  nucleic acid-binding Zn-ribbon protein